MNKRGEPLSLTWMISIIVLVGFLVVIFLMILGIIPGPTEWFGNIVGGKVNTQAISTGCQTACAGGLDSDWCKARKVYFDEKQKTAEMWSCEDLAKQNKIAGLLPCDKITGCPIPVTPTPTPTPTPAK